MNTNKNYITPIRNYTDKDGSWWIKFKEKDVKNLFKKYQFKSHK